MIEFSLSNRYRDAIKLINHAIYMRTISRQWVRIMHQKISWILSDHNLSTAFHDVAFIGRLRYSNACDYSYIDICRERLRIYQK